MLHERSPVRPVVEGLIPILLLEQLDGLYPRSCYELQLVIQGYLDTAPTFGELELA